MKKLPLLLLTIFLLSACNQSKSANLDQPTTEDPSVASSDQADEIELPQLTVVPSGQPTEAYHEIETGLTSASFDEAHYLEVINQEIERLQKEGKVFWLDSEKLSKNREVMPQLRENIECENGIKSEETCEISALAGYPKHLPSTFKFGDCLDEFNCIVSTPKFAEDLFNEMEQLGEIYAWNDDIYMVGSLKGDDNYTIYKNEEEIFSSKMHFSSIGLTEEAVMVLGSPAFTFNSDEFIENGNEVNYTSDIFYKGETLNKKYDLEASSHLFSYKDKIGLVGEKNGKTFFFFNGQKVSEDFDKIITVACCMVFEYPIEVDENGILFFMAERGGKYYFAEVDLNKYLKNPKYDLYIKPNGKPVESYKEIETSLTDASFDDGIPERINVVNQEVERLQKEGKVFWHDSTKEVARIYLERMDSYVLCPLGKESCYTKGLSATPDNVPEGFDIEIEECSNDWGTGCLITRPDLSENFFKNLGGNLDLFLDGKDLYTVTFPYARGQNTLDDTTIYKNTDVFFKRPMTFVDEGPVIDVVKVSGEPAFAFLEQLKKASEFGMRYNILFKGETLNEKYQLSSAYYPFSYKDKLGFIGGKDGKTFFFFNGQKVSDGFDFIRTSNKGTYFAYPIKVDQNGTLFFMAKRGEQYYFVEVDLNKYL